MKIHFLLAAVVSQVIPAAAEEAPWRQLFNGQNLDGWVIKLNGHELGDNYGDTFRVVDGVIAVRYDQYDDGFGARFGHLFTEESFGDYHLAVEYRFVGEDLPTTPGWARRNSGVMLHAQPPESMGRRQDFPRSVEFQFLASLAAGEPRSTGNLCTPGTHVWIDGRRREQHVLPSTGPTFAPGEWVRAEALVERDRIRHLINGEQVHEYERPEVGGDPLRGYEGEPFVNGTPLTEGHIALQAEGSPIEFRKVEIRDLTE